MDRERIVGSCTIINQPAETRQGFPYFQAGTALALSKPRMGRQQLMSTSSSKPGTSERVACEVDSVLRDEKLFSDTIIESMPGVLYLYDRDGHFLRWNHNFEVVSGYGPGEISRMRPLDFYAAEDRALVDARIREVFLSGESSVEAPFLSKSGTRTPYFFTGRRVMFEDRECLAGVGIDISDRVRAEERLAESERRYRELVEHANSIILRWDSGGRVTFLNEFGQRFFGYTAAEIIGRHVIGTLVPPVGERGDDLQHLMAEICAAPQAFEQNTNENMRRNGERVWISWTNRIECDDQGKVVQILSIGTDITARRLAEERLRESEAHLVEAQRIAKIGSWELDLQSNRFKWSEQVSSIYGIRHAADQSTFDDFLAYVPAEDRERLQAALHDALNDVARFDIQHRIRLSDGSEKVVHSLADVRRDARGTPVSLAGTVHDVTDRVRMEMEREQRLRAEEADRIKSVFLATMSHELRTPLNSIIGFTGILLQGLAGPLNSEQNKQLDMVRSSARHLLALVNDVLDISRIEAGQMSVASAPFDARRSIDKVLALVSPQATAKQLALRTQVTGPLGQVVGDERRFEQVLLNLLSNAIKFTDRGEVTVVAECHDDGMLQLQVRDTGIGIRREDLQTLFQPFRQVDSGLSRRHEGTGLGLAISRRLTELMGGQISATSVPGRGSTFTVILPIHDVVD
jgi:PAS domain S-box-containing protein